MKKQPKTIADLDINWTFNGIYGTIAEIITHFNKLNLDTYHLKIKCGKYKFFVLDKEFEIELYSENYSHIGDLIYHINNKIYYYYHIPIELVKFELILPIVEVNGFNLVKGSFRIHVK